MPWEPGLPLWGSIGPSLPCTLDQGLKGASRIHLQEGLHFVPRLTLPPTPTPAPFSPALSTATHQDLVVLRNVSPIRSLLLLLCLGPRSGQGQFSPGGAPGWAATSPCASLSPQQLEPCLLCYKHLQWLPFSPGVSPDPEHGWQGLAGAAGRPPPPPSPAVPSRTQFSPQDTAFFRPTFQVLPGSEPLLTEGRKPALPALDPKAVPCILPAP